MCSLGTGEGQTLPLAVSGTSQTVPVLECFRLDPLITEGRLRSPPLTCPLFPPERILPTFVVFFTVCRHYLFQGLEQDSCLG